MDNVMDIEPVTNPPIEESIEIPQKQFNEEVIRNKEILNSYLDGVTARDLSIKYNLSVTRIYAIINANKEEGIINKEFEKSRRIMRLKKAEMKASPNLAPKDVTELVKVIEAQRKEIEGDEIAPQSVTNIQINMNEINAKTVNDRLEFLRSIISPNQP